MAPSILRRLLSLDRKARVIARETWSDPVSERAAYDAAIKLYAQINESARKLFSLFSGSESEFAMRIANTDGHHQLMEVRFALHVVAGVGAREEARGIAEAYLPTMVDGLISYWCLASGETFTDTFPPRTWPYGSQRDSFSPFTQARLRGFLKEAINLSGWKYSDETLAIQLEQFGHRTRPDGKGFRPALRLHRFEREILKKAGRIRDAKALASLH